MRLSSTAFGAFLLLVAWLGLGAQPEQAKPVHEEPPSMTMGKRVLAARIRAAPVSTLVIATDAAAYTRAIGEWSLERRFPVLIDDGSAGARHNIARFIHGYKPKQILLLGGDGSAPSREDIEGAIAAAWGAPEGKSLGEHWRGMSFTPPGVVVASESDPAWTAALALGADRGQPIVWLDQEPGSISAVESEQRATAWRRDLRERVDGLGWSWAALGDDIDALTVCLSMPSKLRIGERIMAMTDFIGRNDDHTAWGVSGMISGTEAEAAYRAMCGLFLQPRSVWLFDGYEGNFGAEYAMDRPAMMFRQAGFPRVLADPRPNLGVAAWQTRQRGGMDAGLIFINTKGHSSWFDLAGSRAYGSDVPVLRQPATVHFVHSFSAQFPASPQSIAGRWMDQGAFVYYGAVDEPGLAAFLTPEQATGRLLTGIPAGFAFRYDNTNVVWKVNYFGDPLFTLGNIPEPTDGPIELEGATLLSEHMRTTLREQDFAGGVGALVMLNRHADVVRVCRSLLSERADELTPELIETALLSHHFEREYSALAALYARLPLDRAGAARNTTILWQALRPELDRVDADELSLLRLAIRSESAVEDAAALAPALRRVFGEGAVRSMYAQLISETDNAQVREKLQRASP